MYPHGIPEFGLGLSGLEVYCDAYPSPLVRLHSDNVRCILANVVGVQQQTFRLLRYLKLVGAHRYQNCVESYPTKELGWLSAHPALGELHF